MTPSIKYSIIYVRTNIMSDERISIGLVYVTESVLSILDTLHRYSNNYVVFSPVVELNVSESLMSPQRLYGELIQ